MVLPFVCQSGWEEQPRERELPVLLPKIVLTEGEGRIYVPCQIY